MTTLLIMNAATEQMLGTSLSDSDIQAAMSSAWRNLWLIQEGDIVILPKAIAPEMMNYMSKLLTIDMSLVTLITPQQPNVITDALLNDPCLYEQVKSLIGDETNWTINACYQSQGVARFVQKLGLTLGGKESFVWEKGPDSYNRKSDFRYLATESELPIPSGEVVHDQLALEKAINRHIKDTGTVIIKDDIGVAGLGNIAVTQDKRQPLPGVFQLYTEKEFNPATIQIDHTVIESYHAAKHMLFVEFFIKEDGRVDLLNLGEIRLEENATNNTMKWIGLDLHTTLPPILVARWTNEAARFVQHASNRGYRGYIDVDAIVTDRHQLLFNESNGRWGGCTVLHHLAERLIGHDYAATHVISARRAIWAPSFSFAEQKLDDCELAFCPSRKAGIVILAFNDNNHQMEIVMVADSLSAARAMERQYLTSLAE